MSDTIHDQHPVLLDVKLIPVPDRHGHYTFEDPHHQGRRLIIDGPALTLLAAFDGERTCTEIAQAIAHSPLGMLYDEDFVCALAQALVDGGWAMLSDTPHSRPNRLKVSSVLLGTEPLRHRCVGCGRSCEGHPIGPLDPAFLDRLPDIIAHLSPHHADLSDTQTVVTSNQDASYLAMTPQASCIFLGTDRRCRIHAHLGAAAKPLVCRLFPLQIVDTEQGLRVASTRCFEAHRSWEPEPPALQPVEVDTVEAITGIPLGDMPPPDIRGLNPRVPLKLAGQFPQHALEHHTQQVESRLFAHLQRHDTPLLDVLLSLTGTPAERISATARSPLALPKTAAAVLLGYVRTLGASSELDRTLDAPPESHHAAMQDLLETLLNIDDTEGLELSDRELAYGWYVVRQWFHVR
ncbi:MAG: YkgJ family cysteine cluster protein, partial [Myxococcota bacterium]